MLNDVVSKLVLSQIVEVAQDLINDRSWLLVRAVFQDSLDDSTTVRVDTQLQSMVCDGLHYELDVLKRHLFNAFLDHMVAILVMDTV